MALIELRDIHKVYAKRSRAVLAGVNIRIEGTSRITFTGKSGSGKTTLLQTIAMMLRPDAGQVIVKGEDAGRWSEKKRASWRNQQVGFIFQNYCLIPELNVLDNLLLPGLIRGVSRKKLPGMTLLEQVGLKGFARALPHELSGGEEQKVAIARALVNNPAIILADEPTGNLDNEAAIQVVTLLKSLQSEYGTALLVVTHNQELAQEIGEEMLWLADGRLHTVEGGEDI